MRPSEPRSEYPSISTTNVGIPMSQREQTCWWLSNRWRRKSTREVLMWSRTGRLAPLLWGQADWGPGCSGAWDACLLLQVRCLYFGKRSVLQTSPWAFLEASWDDSQLKVLASHCHKPVLTVRSKKSARYFGHGCDFSRKLKARSYMTESRKVYVPCQI